MQLCTTFVLVIILKTILVAFKHRKGLQDFFVWKKISSCVDVHLCQRGDPKVLSLNQSLLYSKEAKKC